MMPTHIDLADVLFVATDLCVLSEWATPATIEDVTVEGKTYRPMDPEYYAWLRKKMELAKAACDRGKLSRTAFDALRTRFNSLHDQAMALFGESALLEAIEHLDPKTYAAPGSNGSAAAGKPAEIPKTPGDAQDAAPAPATRCSQASPGIPEGQEPAQPAPVPAHAHARSSRPFSYPRAPSPDLPFDHPVTQAALDEVNAIRDQALSLGWTEAQLYQTRGRFAFPCGSHYGLVCFLSTDHHVGPVSEAAIEIHCRGGAIQRMYRRKP
jgi:hypothetical protein